MAKDISKDISASFLNTPLTLLLILLIILIIFCVMKHKLYNLQSIMFDDDITQNLKYISPDSNNIKIKEYIIILNDVIEKSKLKLKENFENLTQNDLDSELANLQLLSSNLANFNSTTLQNIRDVINNINGQRLINKAIILQLLTDIYTLKYIENVNQGNAITYNEYNKYISPKQNIYYKQYS